MRISENYIVKDKTLPISTDKLSNDELAKYFDRLMLTVNEDLLKYIKD